MALCDPASLLICELLVLLVMAMVGVDDVSKFADFVFKVNGTDFGVVEIGVCWNGGVV